MNQRRKWSSLGLGAVALFLGVSWAAAQSAPSASPVRYQESFSVFPKDWGSPQQNERQIRQVFSVKKEGNFSFLSAVHDAAPEKGKSIPPAVHFGRDLRSYKFKLKDVCLLSWKWRVTQHPQIDKDPWADVAASVYVVTRSPGLLATGRGFKLGWLAAPGPNGGLQRGIVQRALRHDSAGPSWRTEQVNLCELYQQQYGELGDEPLVYVGFVTDADNTRSRAEAGYRDLVLRATPGSTSTSALHLDTLALDPEE